MTRRAEMDPIDRIRHTRHEISAQCDHDPKKLVEHYRKLQQQHQARLIYSPSEPAKKSA